MIVWAAIKSWIKKFLLLVKEYWQIVLGFFVGIFGMISIMSSKGSRKILDKRTDSQSKLDEINKEADKIVEDGIIDALEKHDESVRLADENFENKMSEIEKRRKEIIEKITSSDSPVDEATRELAKELGINIEN